jgi:uncharacterized protein (TIGR02996 family)
VTEEAFIRAILDRPGEDTPRLVYADWLDDHGHPARAAFLRTEATNPGRVGPAAGLDPVWVARVSRPPGGVCGEHIGFARNRPPVTPVDIDKAEAEFGIAFPAEYRAFLLNYNGGRTRLNSCSPSPFPGDFPPEIQPWFSLLPDEQPRTGKNVLLALDLYGRAGRRSYHSFIPMCAAEPGYYTEYAIGCGGRNRGRVFFVLNYLLNQFPGRPRKVAGSLGEFMASIQTAVALSVTDTDD